MHPRYRISQLAAQQAISPALLIARAVEQHGGVAEAAKALDVTEQAVRRWLNKAGARVITSVRVEFTPEVEP
ncbi:MAG: helix-turn-helix domain-containing protein [Anaerolineae bacterium]|nr:helix-turn-helix domain-containing protein [Anaerolineae bacterium]NUQ05967.1 hypothetical protein [Anaerolineae bacterium]